MVQFRKDNMLLEIECDPHSEDPREWDNMGIMVCFHRRYELGDKHDFKPEDFNGWDDLEAQLYDHEDAQVVLPLYLYDHSGITMSTNSFNCRWDSGQVGFIYAEQGSLKDWSEEHKQKYHPNMTDEQILTKILKSEVAVYDQYLTGDVYAYVLYKITKCGLGHEHKEVEDSCCGFYGLDLNVIAEHAGINDIDDWEEVE